MFRREPALLLAIVALAALLRFATLDAKSFWEDEARTALLVSMDLPSLLAALPEEADHPPLHYLLAMGWAKLFGTGEAGLRALSALLGVGVVPVGYLAGRELVSRRTGLVTAGLLAVNPLLVWYSQEARGYVLLVLTSAVALLFFARALRDPRPRELVAWAAFSCMSLATHYYAVFPVAAEILWLLYALRMRRAVLAASATIIAAGAALLPLALAQRAAGGGPSWIADIDLGSRIVQIPGIFLVGFEAPHPFVAAGAAAAFAACGLWLVMRRVDAAARRGALLAAGIGLAAIALPAALALIGIDYLVYKTVIGALLPLTIAVAAGFAAPRAGALGAAAAIGLGALSLAVVVATAWEPKYHREAWREAARALGPPPGPRAVVASPGHAAVFPLRYYLRGSRRLRSGQASVEEVDVLILKRRPLGELSEPRLAPAPVWRAPTAAGYRLVERRDEEYFRLRRYRAARPARLNFEELQRAARGRISPVVMLQEAAPQAGRRSRQPRR